MDLKWNRNALNELMDQAVRAGADELIARLRQVRCETHGGQLHNLRTEKVEGKYRVVWSGACCEKLQDRVRQMVSTDES